MFTVWPQARIYARLRYVSYLLPRTRTRRSYSGNKESIMVSDTIGDFIIRLKNAGVMRKESVTAPYSKLRHAIADKLVASGYLREVAVEGEGVTKTLRATLRYADSGHHQIRGVKRVSKPGRRIYSKVADIHPVKFGSGLLILSTPAGILTGEEARSQNVGGEQLFMIW